MMQMRIFGQLPWSNDYEQHPCQGDTHSHLQLLRKGCLYEVAVRCCFLCSLWGGSESHFSTRGAQVRKHAENRKMLFALGIPTFSFPAIPTLPSCLFPLSKPSGQLAVSYFHKQHLSLQTLGLVYFLLWALVYSAELRT